MFLSSKVKLIAVAVVGSLLVLTVVLAIALGVGLGVGLNNDGSGDSGSNDQVNHYALQDTTIIVGALTPAGRGAVRLSAQDSSTFGAPYRGLGLLPETSFIPAFWRISPSSAMTNTSASHWTLPVNLTVTEGVNALTPVPSAAGDAADLNLGPYTFLIEAFTVDNRPYKPAVLTITIQQGAVNFGTYDNPQTGLLGKSAPSSWPGDTVLLSTGIDRTGMGTTFQRLDFAKTVTFKHANPSRAGGMLNLGFNNCSNILVTGISFTGDMVKVYVPAVVSFGGGSRNMAMRSCNATFTPTTASYRGAIQFTGCSNCEVTDFYASNMNSGIVDQTVTFSPNVNITITRFRMRRFYNNAIWIANSKNLTLIDCVTMAAMRYTADHVDHLQVADGAAPQGLRIIRHMMLQAEGNAGSQGFFGGGGVGFQGYIDDNSTFGSFSTRRGNVLTVTKSGGIAIGASTWVNGANFAQPAQFISNKIQVGGVEQYLLDRDLAAEPGLIHTAPFSDLTINGLVYTGFAHNSLTLRGLSGRGSLGAFTSSFVNARPETVPWTIIKGTISGNILNVTELVSGAPLGPPMTVQLLDGSPISVDSRRTELSGWGTQPGTYVLGGNLKNYTSVTTFRVAADMPVAPNQGPSFDMSVVDTPSLWSGHTDIRQMYVWSTLGHPGYRASSPTGNATLPATVTLDPTSNLWNRNNYTVSGLAFAQGDPQARLMELTNDEWAKLSFDEVLARHVAALTPRVGGPLAATATVIGAFTPDGLWNDGSGKRPY